MNIASNSSLLQVPLDWLHMRDQCVTETPLLCTSINNLNVP